jgi:hypothetical protein
MHRWLAAVLLSLALVGCGPETQTLPDCDLDVEKLTGPWISLTGGGGGSDRPDKYARVKFFEEDGTRKAIYTAGQIAPGSPVTNKYTYTYIEKTSLGDVLYSINMFPNKNPQRIERLRKDNRRLDVKFEGRIYVKVDAKRCSLVINDMYVTYVKGEETIDSNPTGTRTYLRANPKEPPLSFVHCDESRQIIPFATREVDWDSKPVPLDPKSGIFKGEPAFFHYVEKAYEGSKEEIRTKMVEAGVYAVEGATYDFEIWAKDHPMEGLQKIAVEADPEDEDRVQWIAEVTFDSAPVDGIFIEMHRYKTIDGDRELLGNACTLV